MTFFDREEICQRYPASLEVIKKERFDRLQKLMHAEGCQALVVAGSAMVGRKGNLRFVSNYSPTTRHAVALFTATAPPRLLVTYPIHIYWAGSMAWIDDVQLSKEMATDVADWLTSAGCAERTVGMTGAEIVGGSFQAQLADRLRGARFKSVDSGFAAMRVNKTPLDLQFLQLSADLGDAAYDRVKEVTKPGMTESDLFAEIEWATRKQGAEANLVLITSTGRHSTPIPSHRRLAAGDVIVLSLEPTAPGGYIAQTQRTFSLGKPSRQVQEAYEACRRVEEATRDGLLAGRSISEAARAGMKAFQQVGGSDQSMVLGHGLGIDMGEGPRVSEDDGTILNPGMVIALHPSVYRNAFGVGLGNAYEITKRGPRSLSRTTNDLIVI